MEKHGNKYRIRKMINGRTYILSFDHKPRKEEIERELAKKYNKPVNSDTSCFGECLADYIIINNSILEPTTLQEKKALFRKLPKEFLEKRVCDFTEQYVQSFLNTYYKEPSPRTGKKRSPKTISNLWGDISVILRKYGRHDFHINLPAEQMDESYFPTEDDVMRIRYHIMGKPLEIPFLIAMMGGLREGEICALTVKDFQNDMIKVNKSMYEDKDHKEPGKRKWVIKPKPKTEKSNRFVPIPHALQEMVHEQGYIYRYVPNRLLKQLHKAQDELGIPRFRFHDLRAYYASIAHELGVPDKYIMKNTGHKTASTLHKHYQKALRDKQTVQDQKILDHFDIFM